MSGTEQERDDEELRRLFGGLRAADRRHTPAFDAVLASARALGARRRARTPLTIAAAALLVVAAAGTLQLLHRRTTAAEFALSRWQSPTAALLRGPGATLLESVQPVSASVINLDLFIARTTHE